MPELPEVEIARRNLERWFKGHALCRAHGTRTRIFRGAKLADFEKLKGPLTVAQRKGKYLMLGFGEGGLLAHLGMTGKFVKRPPGVDEPYSRARFELDDGEVIHFRDPRMFGRLEPAPSGRLSELKAVKQLGFDPVNEGIDGPRLKAALGRSKQDLKLALMDQTRIAGLGNIHAAEALFRAGLHPSRKPPALTDADWARLAEAVKASIQFGLDEQQSEEPVYLEESGGDDNPFFVYGREGQPCRTCRTPIESFGQGGRTTYYCPSCQPKVKDRVPRAKVKKKVQAKSRAKRTVRGKGRK